MVDRIMRLPEVKTLSGIGRTMIYQQMDDGTFPRAVKIGARSIGWLESEVVAWLASRVAASRGSAA